MPSDQFGRDIEEDLGYDLDLLREEEDEYLEENDNEMDD